jgi:hypothetical protein
LTTFININTRKPIENNEKPYEIIFDFIILIPVLITEEEDDVFFLLSLSLSINI